MSNTFKQILLSLVLIVLLALLVNPAGTFMPTPAQMFLEIGAVVVYALFVVFVWNERALDERERVHRQAAGRVAFLSGSAVLMLGIVVQSLSHALDIWLPAALAVMLVAKMLTRARVEETQ
jgi:cobalamin synthase